MIFIIFRLALEVWETGILQTLKIRSNLYKLKYDDMSSAIVAAQFLYSLTVRFSLHNAQICQFQLSSFTLGKQTNIDF